MTETEKQNIEVLENRFNEIKELMEERFPCLKTLLKPKNWTKIQKHYINKYKSTIVSGKEIIESVCFLEDFIMSLQDTTRSIPHKVIVNGVEHEITKALSYADKAENQNLRNGVQNIIKQIFTSIDVDATSNNSDYRNRIAELMTFNYFCDCENCIIEKIEKPLGTKKYADFELLFKDGVKMLIEVLSIHNIIANKHENALTLSQFIDDKIENKYIDKTKGIPIDNLYILPIVDFEGIPISWRIDLNKSYALPLMTVVKDSSNKMALRYHNEIINNINIKS